MKGAQPLHKVEKQEFETALANSKIPGLTSSADSQPTNDNSDSKLRLLMHMELCAREAETVEELNCMIANELRKLVQARQVFVFSCSNSEKLKISAISSLPKVDRNVPLVREIEQTISFLSQNGDLENQHYFSIPDSSGEVDTALGTYPFRELMWSPFINRSGKKIGGVLMASQSPWSDEELMTLNRVSATFAHAHTSLEVENSIKPRFDFRVLKQRKYLAGALTALVLSMAFPVSMTVLAPFEIASRSPFVVSAYLDGAIKEIFVEPGETVAKGQSLVRFVDTVQENLLSIAQKEVMVSEAKLKRTNQLAFENPDGRHELGTAISELELKKAELKLARDQSEQTLIAAERSGLAIFSDKQSLIGKPVAAGERILEIADPSSIEVEIALPVRDSILLEPGNRVKLFLDSDPLNSRQAIVEYIDYKAGQTPSGNLAYKITARLNDEGEKLPRIGVQGTAQLYGDTVPLAMYLFRRPLTSVRQWLGI